MKRSAKCLLLLTAGGLLFEAPPAAADEIVVTARKREEVLLKVPVIATALQAEQLDQYAISDMNSITERVPGLNAGGNVGSIGTQITLRGVGTTSLNANLDQSVSLNVDGLQLTNGNAFRSSQFDMAQVTVLKGPQALFFGKASPAGVIAIKTKDPTDEIEVLLRGGYEFVARGKVGEMILSGPVSDNLRVRLATQWSQIDGYWKNGFVAGNDTKFGTGDFGAQAPKHRRFPHEKNLFVRGTVVWEPTDRLNARLKVNYMQEHIQGSAGLGQYAACPEGTAGLVLDFIGGPEDCKFDRTLYYADMDPAFFEGIGNGGRNGNFTEQTFGTLELNYELTDTLALTSVTGLYFLRNKNIYNAVASNQFAPPFAVSNSYNRDDVTEEIRLTSNFDGPLNFLLGGFYQNADIHAHTFLPVNQNVNTVLAAIGSSTRLPNILIDTQYWIDIESTSLFGQVLYNITPTFELGAGVRWTKEDRRLSATDYLLTTLFGLPPFDIPFLKDKISANNWAPELSLTYRPNDDLTFFANLKQAYKSGSFDVTGRPVNNSDPTFGDERVRGGEIGIKGRTADRSLTFNTAFYYYKFTGLQVAKNVFDAGSGSFVTKTQNAAGAKVYGVDFDVTYTPPSLEGLTLFGALNWNRARYSSFPDAECYGGQTISLGCDRIYDPAANRGLGGFLAQDLSGRPLLRAPEWSANFGFNYELPVKDMVLVIGSDSSYSSKYQTNLSEPPETWQKGYFKTNASVTLKAASEAWEVALIGNNLTDKLVYGNCGAADFANGGFFGVQFTGAATSGPSGFDEFTCQGIPGRSVSLRLTLRPTAWGQK